MYSLPGNDVKICSVNSHLSSLFVMASPTGIHVFKLLNYRKYFSFLILYRNVLIHDSDMVETRTNNSDVRENRRGPIFFFCSAKMNSCWRFRFNDTRPSCVFARVVALKCQHPTKVPAARRRNTCYNSQGCARSILRRACCVQLLQKLCVCVMQDCIRTVKYRWYVAGSVSIAKKKKEKWSIWSRHALSLFETNRPQRYSNTSTFYYNWHFYTHSLGNDRCYVRKCRRQRKWRIILASLLLIKYASFQSVSRASIKEKAEFWRRETLRFKTTVRKKLWKSTRLRWKIWKKSVNDPRFRSRVSLYERAYGVETNSGSRLASPGSPPNKEQRHFHN